MTTTANPGNWNAAGTWTGGVVPGAGAVAVLNHVVTVTANQTIGTSPFPGTDAVTLNAGGGLVINAGVTLTIKGDFHQGNAPVTIGSGAGIEFDASPTLTNHYSWFTGNSGGNTLNVITINGTAGARSFVRSNAGGGSAAMTAQSVTRTNLVATYCDFTRLGSASVPAVQLYDGTFDLQHCVFDTCGSLETFYEPATGVVRFDHVTMTNTVASAYCLSHANSPAALTSGTRVITGCVFDKTCLHTFRDYTITDTLFSGNPPLSAIAAPALPWATCSGNLFVATGGTESKPAGDVADFYYLHTTATGNPHYFQHDGGTRVHGGIFEYTGTTDDGDGNLMGSPTGPITITVDHCIGLSNGAGTPGGSGTIFSHGGSVNLTTSLFHNTWYVRDQAAVTTGETYAGRTGMIARCSDNLVHATAGASFGKMYDMSSTVNDVIAAANAHHNGGFHLPAGSNLKGYDNLDFTSGSPGTADVDGVDPLFVDPARDLAKWDSALAGGAGSATHALAELKKKNDAAGYNPAYLISDLIAYVKAGFVPQAAAYHAASDTVLPSNGWIGAIEGVVGGGGGGGGGTGLITFVDAVSAPSTDGEDITTAGMDTSQADLLVAEVGSFLGGGATTVLDSKGNTWAPLTNYHGSTGPQLQAFYVASPLVSAAGVANHTFTTVGAGNFPSICVAAFHGVKKVSPFDQQNGAASDSATTIQAGTGVTPTEANELVIAGCMSRHNETVTIDAPSGFTIVGNVGASGLAMRTALAYKIQTAAVLANPTWTIADPQYCAANLASFKAEPAVVAAGDLGLLGIG